MKWIFETFDYHVWNSHDNNTQFKFFVFLIAFICFLLGWVLSGEITITKISATKYIEVLALSLNIWGAVEMGRGLIIKSGDAYIFSCPPTETPSHEDSLYSKGIYCPIELEHANRENLRIIDLKNQSQRAVKGLTLLICGFIIQFGLVLFGF